MADQEDQFFAEPEEEELQQIREIIDQPIPIYDKPKIAEPKNISFKMLQLPKKQDSSHYVPFKLCNKPKSQQSEDDQNSQFYYDSPFTDFYSEQQCVFKKFNNLNFSKWKGVNYFSGCFVHKNVFLDQSKQQLRQLTQVLKQYYDVASIPMPQAKKASDLKFRSDFQSGNLFAAFKISQTEYDLVMQNDTNSKGNNQWFYFKVQNMQAAVEYTFNVVNFTKSDSLFNYGMAPAIYSKVQYEKSGKGWRRVGKEISYKRGALPRQNSKRHYYKLSFKYINKHQNDYVEMAHSYPYTYTQLQNYLSQKISRNKDVVTKVHIGKTLGKNNIQGLQITIPINKKRDNRKAIIIMARQHPGQTQGSFVCEGVIDRILSKTKQAQFLKKNYVIYVIPMVNPDGVIFGHYRTNLGGNDLNRRWDISQNQKETLNPQIIAIKLFIQQISKERDLRFILDLHGHSKKMGSFFYGNPCTQNPDVVRIYPFLCDKLSPAIQFLDCTFATQQQKRKAARVYLSFFYRLLHVYTFQSSFYGYFKQGKKCQFTPKQYNDLGGTLVQGLFMQLEHQVKYQQSFQFNLSKNMLSTNKQLANSVFVKILSQLKNNTNLLQAGAKCESGSDSKPDEAQININEIVKVEKIVKREPSTPQISDYSTKNSNRVSSRKGFRDMKQIKEISKPIRNMKVLQISRVNSVLPDKYQLGLQPIKRMSESSVTRNSSMIMRISCDTQTDFTQDSEQKEYKNNEIEQKNLSSSMRVETPTLKDRRYSSVVKTQNRNNIIFKIDLMSRDSKTKTITDKKKSIRHAYSQTMLSFTRKEFDKYRNKQMFPLVDPLERQNSDLKDARWLRCTSIKTNDSVRIGMKREAQMFLNGMVKKYFADKELKFKQHAISKCPQERPIQIRKKQLFSSKK